MGLFGNNKKVNTVDALVNQIIGGQSVMYRLFTQSLKIDPKEIRKIELTYFGLAVMTRIFLQISNLSNKEQTLDKVTLSVIEKSIQNCDETISLKQAVDETRNRFIEYDALLRPLFSNNDKDSATTLLMHFYECVKKDIPKGAIPPMTLITISSPLIQQFILDHIDFIKAKID